MRTRPAQQFIAKIHLRKGNEQKQQQHHCLYFLVDCILISFLYCVFFNDNEHYRLHT